MGRSLICKAKICSARTELWGKGLSWGFQVVRTVVWSAGWSYQQTANDLDTDEFTLCVLFWGLTNISKPEASSLNQGKEAGKLRNLIPCKGRTPHLLHRHGFLVSKRWHLTVKSGTLLVYSRKCSYNQMTMYGPYAAITWIIAPEFQR